MVKLEAKDTPLAHHKAGKMFTRTGYGSKIPTPVMVKIQTKWRRVYCTIYSNVGTRWVIVNKRKLIVTGNDNGYYLTGKTFGEKNV